MRFYRLLQSIQRNQRRFLQEQWLLLVVLLGAVTIMLWSGSVSAAPVNQTVPPPTATKEATAVPTATPRQKDDDDRRDPEPTATQPIPTSTPTPEGPQATVSVVRLNVRQGPGLTFPVLGVVASGQTVRVLARNEAGDWWQICCLPGTTQSGWVAAQYLQANFDFGQTTTLIPVAGDLPATPEPTPFLAEDPNAIAAATSLNEGVTFTIEQDPLYTWQGQEVALIYHIANTTITNTTNLTLRNELPTQLRLVAIEEIDGGALLTETTPLSTTIFSIDWPSFAAGAEVTARVRVQVADDLPDGSVIDNLAVIVADGITAITNGISIGMPPTTLPEFR